MELVSIIMVMSLFFIISLIVFTLHISFSKLNSGRPTLIFDERVFTTNYGQRDSIGKFLLSVCDKPNVNEYSYFNIQVYCGCQHDCRKTLPKILEMYNIHSSIIATIKFVKKLPKAHIIHYLVNYVERETYVHSVVNVPSPEHLFALTVRSSTPAIYIKGVSHVKNI